MSVSFFRQLEPVAAFDIVLQKAELISMIITVVTVITFLRIKDVVYKLQSSGVVAGGGRGHAPQ